VTLKAQDGDLSADAILLRVIPISELEQKWVFPQEEFANAELSMIDSRGDYILKGYSFKNSNFFEFYNSYNPTDPVSSKELFDRITSSTGSVTMNNSHGQECILAFTPLSASVGWTLLGFVPAQDLHVGIENWLLVGVVSAGLLILFLCDLFYMLSLNKRLQAAAMTAHQARLLQAQRSKARLPLLTAAPPRALQVLPMKAQLPILPLLNRLLPMDHLPLLNHHLLPRKAPHSPMLRIRSLSLST
jgi:hypothetical protein